MIAKAFKFEATFFGTPTQFCFTHPLTLSQTSNIDEHVRPILPLCLLRLSLLRLLLLLLRLLRLRLRRSLLRLFERLRRRDPDFDPDLLRLRRSRDLERRLLLRSRERDDRLWRLRRDECEREREREREAETVEVVFAVVTPFSENIPSQGVNATMNSFNQSSWQQSHHTLYKEHIQNSISNRSTHSIEPTSEGHK